MDEKEPSGKRVAVVLYDSDYGFAMNIVKELYLGPGEPGPGDKWNFPPEFVEAPVEEAPRQEPPKEGPAAVPSRRRSGLFQRPTRRG